MQFYNLKTRSHVDVPDTDVHKMKMVRATKNGEQTRYAFTATHEGQKLFKFVSEKAYQDSTAKEAPEGDKKAAPKEAKADSKADSKGDAKSETKAKSAAKPAAKSAKK